jgi:hypothetical protein
LPLYDKAVRHLMHDLVLDLGLQPGQIIDREQVLDWFTAKYPLVKEGTVAAHLIRMSINARSRLHYRPQADGSDDLFFQLNGGHFRLYEPATDPAPIRAGSDTPPPDRSPESPAEASRFAYEHDLRDYLARNLSLIEPGLKLYSEEGVTGVEYPAGGRFIDILAVDDAGQYVVIELKVSKGYDRVVGQLLRYIGWIEKHHAEPGQQVRGVIVAKEITEDLVLACARLRDVQLFNYELSVSLKRVAM